VSDRIKQAISKAQTIGPAPKRPWSPLDVILPTPDEVREMTPVERFMGLMGFAPDLLTSGASKAIMLPAFAAEEFGRRALRNFPRRIIEDGGRLDPNVGKLADVLESTIKENPKRWGMVQDVEMDAALMSHNGNYGEYLPSSSFHHILAEKTPKSFETRIRQVLDNTDKTPSFGNRVTLADPSDLVDPANPYRHTAGFDPNFARQTIRHEGRHIHDDIIGGQNGPLRPAWISKLPYQLRPQEILGFASQATGDATPTLAAKQLAEALRKYGYDQSALRSRPAITKSMQAVAKALGVTDDELVQLVAKFQ
jgi:hypothetical protein